MTTDIAFRATVDLSDEASPDQAFALALPQLEALQPHQVCLVHLNVPAIVARVLGALPRIQALRAEAASLAGFDPTHFDELERCALALHHANAMCRISSRPGDDLAELNLEATGTRGRLHADASALAVRNIIDRASLRAYRGLPGYKRVASDLQLLVTLLNDHWRDIEGKCACTREELVRAEKLAARMLRLVGRRRVKPEEQVQWRDRRDRAFTVLIRHYHAVRRAVVFLRWDHGDADLFAPSLYAGRRRRPSKVDEPDDDVVTATTLNEPVVAPPAESTPTGGDNPGALPHVGNPFLVHDEVARSGGVPHTRVRVDGPDMTVAAAEPTPPLSDVRARSG